MKVRTAERGDRPAIRDVARRSLEASYSLEQRAITAAVREWYGEERLAGHLDREDRLLLVAERERQVVAFSESERTPGGGEATLLWLHVDPAYRGAGVGDALFEETRDRLEADGAERVAGRVLADNDDGNAFYEAQGFERVGRDEVTVAGRSHVEHVWAETAGDGLQAIRAADGDTVYVDDDEWDAGSDGEFYMVYAEADGSEHYGYYCSNCNRLANAMDAMGRIECDHCGNARKATRWDAAYL